MNYTNWRQSEILITGGTGSLGKALVKLLVEKYKPRGIRVYSRDELKQSEMKNTFGENKIAYLIGDIRDRTRMERAMNNVNIVIHAAAMKQVPACEYNPFEAVKTNIEGTISVIDSAINNKVNKVMFISTDKAVYPVNLYGMTKGVAEKLVLHSNVYTGGRAPFLSCCRYGNVLGSRGSLVEILKQHEKGKAFFLTDKRMTRFWISLEQAAKFVLNNIECMQGGEIFIPRLSTMNILSMIKTIAPEAEIETTGIRRGEKIHECLISKEESKNVIIQKDKFIITQDEQWASDEWDYKSTDKTKKLDLNKL